MKVEPNETQVPKLQVRLELQGQVQVLRFMPEVFEKGEGGDMIVKHPIWFKVEAKEAEDGEWELCYEEGFREEDRQAFKFGAEVAEAAMKASGILATIELKQNSAVLKTKLPHDDIYNILAGEFLSCSTVGKMSIVDLMLLASMRAAGVIGKPRGGS